jgi:hypothetical protein
VFDADKIVISEDNLKEMPVPGTDTVPVTPCWPTLTVNGAPPTLQLSPFFDRLSLTRE